MIQRFQKIFSFFEKFKIPTILGLAIITAGLLGGIFLNLQNQLPILLTKATGDQTPQNITISNIEDKSATISWLTSSKATGFITFGQTTASEQTILDDRDINTPNPRITHFVTLKKLTPQTTYQFKIFSGKNSLDKVQKFTTSKIPTNQNGLKPIVGSVLNGDQPVEDSIAFLIIYGANVVSAPIKNLGNFIIPISNLKNVNLTETFILEKQTQGKIMIFSNLGQASLIFNLSENLPPIQIGQNIDLTTSQQSTKSVNDNIKFDLNDDGNINTTDYSLAIKNLGKKIRVVRIDLNTEEIIDQKYLDGIQEQISDRLNQ